MPKQWLARAFRFAVASFGCCSISACGTGDVSEPERGAVAGAAASGGAWSTAGAPAGAAASGAGGVGGSALAGSQALAGRAAAGGGGTAAAGRGAAGSTAAAGRGAAGAGAAGTTSPTPGERATLYTQDGALYDQCGEKVVLRGVNHPTLYVDREGAALPEIAKTGANAVRLFWFARMGIQIREAEAAIAGAIREGMIPILELHDSTCEWNLDGIVSYWTSTQAVELIRKYEAHLIVNIANETSPPSATEFRTKYTQVIADMREAGIKTPLMIDGGNCGRDYQMLLSQGPALLEADPDHNLIFSAHLYNRMSQQGYGDVFTSALDKKLTFVVGEFAHKSPPGCGSSLDYKSLLSEADKHGIGWLAWSWGDDNPGTDWNSDCAEFDMTTTFSFDSLRGWGEEVAVSLPGSIKNTSVRPASMLGGACR
jgi:mannan endo-1,4-beta-mannosidase